jgi:hypothetical protein
MVGDINRPRKAGRSYGKPEPRLKPPGKRAPVCVRPALGYEALSVTGPSLWAVGFLPNNLAIQIPIS